MTSCGRKLFSVLSWLGLILILSISGQLLKHDNGYIIIDCRDGLSNRLRLLAGYMYVMRATDLFSHIFMIWDINDACPGHFLQLYEPIPNVTFISSLDLPYLTPMANTVYHASYMNYLEVLNSFNLHHKSDSPSIWHNSRLEMYSLYQPVLDIIHIVKHYVTTHSICKHAAIHVRRTDLDQYIDKIHRNHTNDSDYFKFIDLLPTTMSIFLMTDNPMTQEHFLQKYGHERILIYQPINIPERIYHNHRHRLTPDRIFRKLNTVRYTTLQHTLIDVMIAAHSSIFMGSSVSSLSELVHLVNMTYVSKLEDPCYRHN